MFLKLLRIAHKRLVSIDEDTVYEITYGLWKASQSEIKAYQPLPVRGGACVLGSADFPLTLHGKIDRRHGFMPSVTTRVRRVLHHSLHVRFDRVAVLTDVFVRRW